MSLRDLALLWKSAHSTRPSDTPVWPEEAHSRLKSRVSLGDVYHLDNAGQDNLPLLSLRMPGSAWTVWREPNDHSLTFRTLSCINS